ncbi:MAG: hypothetical protein H0T46_31555 [Deltaproteobacteria bacterium]|nr:hypothetical protein [Deltaproteobacteria bacterium]
MRRVLAAALVIASTGVVARAQPTGPADPYGEPEPTQDEVLNEQIAQSLVQRAQELYDARVFVDAKQLAVEALVKSPKGQAGSHARFLIAAINKQLGITEGGDRPPEPIKPPVVDLVKQPEVPSQPERPSSSYVTPARVHGALYAGLIGTTVGSFFSKDTPAGGAIPLGIVTGVAGGLYAPRLTDRLGWNDAQIMTAGAGSTWLGFMGAFIADAVKTDGTNARQVLVGASIGSTVGLAAGAGLAMRDTYTAGDIALVDTLAGIGVAGGFTIGMLMQPAESEAYSVNAVLGAAGGLVVGLVAAPNTNTTPRRMLRVAGLSAAGGAAPFLLYAAIRNPDSKADERVTGLLSTAGLLVGAYLGLRLTRDMDVGLDVKPGAKQDVEDAPAALVGRHSDGRWALGMIGVKPLSLELAPQPGLAMPLVGGAF